MNSLDLTLFERIEPKAKHNLAFSILENGKVKFSHSLKEKLSSKTIEIQISYDGTMMLIKDNGQADFKIRADGYINMPEIAEKAIRRGVVFPANYVAKWNEEGTFWVGVLENNSNVKKNNLKKKKAKVPPLEELV